MQHPQFKKASILLDTPTTTGDCSCSRAAPGSMYGALYGYYCDKLKSTETRGHLFESKSLAQAKREAKGFAANREWRVREVFRVSSDGELDGLIQGGYTILSNDKDSHAKQ